MGNCCQTLKQSIDRKNLLCIWVLGGPCSGRSTQCKILAEHLQMVHICPEAIVRDCLLEEEEKKMEARIRRLVEKRNYTYNAIKTYEKMTEDEKEFLGTQHEKYLKSSNTDATFFSKRQMASLSEDKGDSEDELYSYYKCPKIVRDISHSIRNGKQIDPQLLTTLLKGTMIAERKWKNGYLLDGYPRDVTQAEQFVYLIGEPHLVIILDGPVDVLKKRFIARAKETQRGDDNQYTFHTKLDSFNRKTDDIVQMFSSKVTEVEVINGNREIQSVAKECVAAIQEVAGRKFKFKKFKDIKKPEVGNGEDNRRKSIQKHGRNGEDNRRKSIQKHGRKSLKVN